MNRQTKQSWVTTWVVTFICIGVVGAVNSVHGQVVIDTDTVIDADNSFPNSAIAVIDGDSPPTVVDIFEGGEVATISQALSATRGSSVLNMFGGQLYHLTTRDTSTVNFSGGEIFSSGNDGINAGDNSTVNISGGHVRVDDVEDWHAVHLSESSTVNITGGLIAGDDEPAIWMQGSAVLNVSGGRIYNIDGTPAINATGGSVNISGGTVEGFIIARDSFVLLSGGSVQALRATDSSIIEVHGSNLILDDGRLTGFLADGSMIDAAAEMMGSGQILLVPEPSATALLLLGLLSCNDERRKRGPSAG